MTDDALSTDYNEGLAEAPRTILELKREIKEIREDFSRLECKARRDAELVLQGTDERDRLTISLM